MKFIINNIAGFLNGYLIEKTGSNLMEVTHLNEGEWEFRLVFQDGSVAVAQVGTLQLKHGVWGINNAIIEKNGYLMTFDGYCTVLSNDLFNNATLKDLKRLLPSPNSIVEDWVSNVGKEDLEVENFVVRFHLLKNSKTNREVSIAPDVVFVFKENYYSAPLCLVSEKEDIVIKFNQIEILQCSLGYLIKSNNCAMLDRNNPDRTINLFDTGIIRLIRKEYQEYKVVRDKCADDIMTSMATEEWRKAVTSKLF